MPPLISEAIQWWQNGYTPLPVKPDGSKAPAVKTWTQYQKQRPTLPETIELFKVDSDGIGLICGAVSGGLEMLELEGRAHQEGYGELLTQAFLDHNQAELWARITGGYMENTPSSGVHLYYRVDGHALGNRKLARRPGDDGPEVLIETRGEGGFTVIAPSGGRTHPSGKEWWNADVIEHGALAPPGRIPTITADERDTIHAIASTLDQMPVVEPPPPTLRGNPTGELRPGDDFNMRATWKEILEPHGWTIHKHYGGNLYGWRKPNKQHPGISATTGRTQEDRIFVFSTSTTFEAERPYSKFGAYTLLNHSGDYSAAARELRKQGYGSDPKDVAVLKPHTNNTTNPENQPEPTTLEAFWQARPVLTHIHQFALARMVSPWSVLGVCILRVLATIPPYVVLPPTIGGYGSLNTFIALVGPSGVGKGGTDRAARDAIDFTEDIYTAPVGSGEGIAHQYAHRDRQGITRDRDSVLFEVPEVDTLTALGGRQGSTLLSQLRLAFSGERLGFGYADAIKRIPIPADTYRLGLVVGVQPERTGHLIWDADGGTPQRFIWLPATDPAITADPPPEPPQLVIDKQEFERGFLYSKYHVLPIPEQVTATIREQHAKRASGEGDALDGHALFAREKVAQALTFLDNRRIMTLEDWELAGIIMQISDITRAKVAAALDAKMAKSDEARAFRQATRETIIETAKVETALQRISALIVKKANSNGGVAWNDLRKTLASRDRAYYEDALDLLVEEGQVEVFDSPKGQHVRVKR